MSDINEKNVSTLAITEKKPHRPGGCVGIFFQLFDWNRRLAKKKLFSRKLLPPGRSKQGSKKFCGDEKLPKLRLIADENSGGFPMVKKDDFEQKNSMQPPSLVAKLMGLEYMPAKKPDKLGKPTPPSQERFVSDDHLGFHEEDWGMEKRDTRQELRPQKLQKTGSYERRSVTKLGTEALQLRNVLSRPKKHYSKLASPVKSPKSLSARNASRLIGVATKILEPGLQANNRAKGAITYKKSACHVSFDEAILSKLEGQSSCRNCVYSLPTMDTRPETGEHSSVFCSGYVGPSQDSERNKPKLPIASLVREQERPISNRVFVDQEIQPQQHVMGLQCKGQRDREVPLRSKLGNLQEKAVVLPSNAVNETKDFVALNRTLSGQARSRMTVKSDNLKFDSFGKVHKRGDEFISPVRKRRSMNISKQSDHFDLDKQKEMGRNARPQVSGKKDKDVTTFTYTSPMKHKSGISGRTEKRRVQSNSSCNKYPQKNSSSCSKKPLPFKVDPLGEILEQKLKELNFQEMDEFGLGRGTPPKRTSAMILQELISALNAERSYYQNTQAVKSKNHMPDMITNTIFEANPEITKANNNLSPGSVLEASFSNDSCVSSNFDDSSGHKLCADSINYPYNKRQLAEPDSDLLDSATSLRNGKTGKDFVAHLIHQISEALDVLDFLDAKTNRSKLNHAKEVILKAELWFKTQDFSIVQFLLDEMETLAGVMWTNFSSFLGLEDTKEGNLLKGFIFDCLVEYLESKYGNYIGTRLPLCMNKEVMVREVVGEVRRWAGLAGLVTDELIEREMSFKLGKWTDFEIEEFEHGVEIGGDIFEGLVDEIVIELWECKMGLC